MTGNLPDPAATRIGGAPLRASHCTALAAPGGALHTSGPEERKRRREEAGLVTGRRLGAALRARPATRPIKSQDMSPFARRLSGLHFALLSEPNEPGRRDSLSRVPLDYELSREAIAEA